MPRPGRPLSVVVGDADPAHARSDSPGGLVRSVSRDVRGDSVEIGAIPHPHAGRPKQPHDGDGDGDALAPREGSTRMRKSFVASLDQYLPGIGFRPSDVPETPRRSPWRLPSLPSLPSFEAAAEAAEFAAVIYNLIMIPFLIAFFPSNSPALWVLDYLSDAVYLAYFVSSWAAYRALPGPAPWRTRLRVAVDLISLLPLDLVALGFSCPGCLRAWLRLPKILRLHRALHVFGLWETSESFNHNSVRIVQIFVWTIVFSHWLGCVWFLIGDLQANSARDSWIVDAGISDVSVVRQYVASVYWSITVMTTVGFGDIVPVTVPEKIFTLFAELVGAVAYGSVFGNVANLLRALDATAVQHRESMLNIQLFMQYYRIPPRLRRRMLLYFETLWFRHRGVSGNSITEELPSGLRAEVSLTLNFRLMSKVPVFKSINDPSFHKSLSIFLKPLILMPGDTLFRKGEIAKELYFIVNGAVDVIDEDEDDGEIRVLTTLRSGSFFGEIGLLTSKRRSASVVATTYADLFVLTRSDFSKVLTCYPDYKEQIEAVARDRREQDRIKDEQRAASKMSSVADGDSRSSTPGSRNPPTLLIYPAAQMGNDGARSLPHVPSPLAGPSPARPESTSSPESAASSSADTGAGAGMALGAPSANSRDIPMIRLDVPRATPPLMSPRQRSKDRSFNAASNHVAALARGSSEPSISQKLRSSFRPLSAIKRRDSMAQMRGSESALAQMRSPDAEQPGGKRRSLVSRFFELKNLHDRPLAGATIDMGTSGPMAEEGDERFILMPNSFFRFVWEFAMFSWIVFNVITVPLLLCFPVEIDATLYAFMYLGDVFYIADVALRFRTGFYVRGNLVVDIDVIRAHYLLGWFPVDFCSALPLDLIVVGFAPGLVPWLRTIRMLRIARLFSYLTRWEASQQINGELLRIGKVVFWILLSSHLAACVWFVVGDRSDGWVGTQGLLDKSVRTQFVASLYWAVTTMTSVGFGDISATNMTEQLVSIVVMLLGACLYASAFANIAAMVESLDASAARHRVSMANALRFAKHINLPSELQQRVRRQYDAIWRRTKGVDDQKVLEQLSPAVRGDVALYLQKDVVLQVPFLRDINDPHFIKSLATLMKPQIALSGDTIFYYGDIADAMYFIARGSISVIAGDGRGTVLAEQGSGSFFGEVALLFNIRRSATVKASSDCELYVLSKTDFEDVLAVSGHAHTVFEVAQRRRKRTGLVQERGLDIGNRRKSMAMNVPIPEESSDASDAALHAISPEDLSQLAQTGDNLSGDLPSYPGSSMVHEFLLRYQWECYSPESRVVWMWKVVTAVNVVMLSILLPLQYAFSIDTEAYLILVHIGHALLVIDVGSKFVFGFEEVGHEVIDSPRVVGRYLASLSFVTDVLAVVPYWLLAGSDDFRMQALLRLPLLLRVPTLFRVMSDWELFNVVASLQIRLLGVFLWVILVGHWVACVWFEIARLYPANSWLVVEDLEDRQVNIQYSAALYWSMTVLTTVGFGDISAGTNAERIFAVVVMLMGVILYASIFGTVSILLAEGDNRLFRTRSMMNTLVKVMTYMNMPADSQKRIMHYARALWFQGIGRVESEIFCEMPSNLRVDIAISIRGHFLSKMVFLQPFLENESLLRALATVMTSRFFLPGDVVITPGSDIDTLFCLATGKVDVTGPQIGPGGDKIDFNQRPKIERVVVSPGALLGEYDFYARMPATTHAVAVDITEVYSLSLDAIQRVMEYFPEQAAQIRDSMLLPLILDDGPSPSVSPTSRRGSQLSTGSSEEPAAAAAAGVERRASASDTPATQAPALATGSQRPESAGGLPGAVSIEFLPLPGEGISKQASVERLKNPAPILALHPPELLATQELQARPAAEAAAAAAAAGSSTSTKRRRASAPTAPTTLGSMAAGTSNSLVAISRAKNMARRARHSSVSAAARRRMSTLSEGSQSGKKSTVARRLWARATVAAMASAKVTVENKNSVHPSSKWRAVAEHLAALMTLYLLISVPVATAFGQGLLGGDVVFMDALCDLVHLGTIPFRFRLGFYRNGVLEMRPATIAREYLRFWFWVDLVSVLPVSWIAMGMGASNVYLYRQNRLLRVLGMVPYFRWWSRSKMRRGAYVQGLQLFFWILVVTVTTACLWFVAGMRQFYPGFSMDDIDQGATALPEPAQQTSWLLEFGTLFLPTAEQLLDCIYYALTALSTVGFGDIFGVRTREQLFSYVVMLVSSAIDVTVFGKIASFLEALDERARRYREKMDLMIEYCNYRNLPAGLRHRVVVFYNSVWHGHGGYEISELLHDLPRTLRIELVRSIAEHALQANRELRSLISQFPDLLYDLADAFRPVALPADECVFQSGEVATDLYLLVRGECKAVNDDNELLHTVKPGDFSGANKRTVHDHTVITTQFCDFFAVALDEMDALQEKYPELFVKLQQIL